MREELDGNERTKTYKIFRNEQDFVEWGIFVE